MKFKLRITNSDRLADATHAALVFRFDEFPNAAISLIAGRADVVSIGSISTVEHEKWNENLIEKLNYLYLLSELMNKRCFLCIGEFSQSE